MKTIWRHHYVARVSIFLVTVALIAGIVGCGPTPVQYDLTITSGSGGSVTTPGEGTHTYDEGTVVDLMATPDAGYHFVDWTGDVDTIANVNTATTTITMNDDYYITANFVEIIEIWDWYDLDDIRDNLVGSYLLMNDLDSTTAGYEELASPTANGGKGWEPIGTWAEPFRGVFRGQGYEIKDLVILRPDEGHVGFVGDVGPGGVIEHVGVANVVVTGEWDVGGLVGENLGTVSDSYSSGSITFQRQRDWWR